MWWLIFVISFVVLVVAGALYVEFRPARQQAKFDRARDTSTNYANLEVQARSIRNQSSGGR